MLNRLKDVFRYLNWTKKTSAVYSAEIEKRFDQSWERVRARAQELNITQEDIDAEIRAVRDGKNTLEIAR